MSQSVITSLSEMCDQNNGKEMGSERNSNEDNIDGQQSAKRLKTEDSNPSSEVTQQKVVIDKKSDFKREKHRKWILLMSYCGQNYYGMQRQTLYYSRPSHQFSNSVFFLYV